MRIALFLMILLSTGAAPAAPGTPPTVLIFGDSLSAAFGLPQEAGWAHLLARRLAARTPPVNLVNASVSGETTAGGLTRLPQLLAAHRPAIVVLALGANDGLRGLPLADTRSNLEAMIRLAKQQGGQVLLVGMRMPPNYGGGYTRKFQALFGEVARGAKVPLVPFLLAGMAERRERFQADGLHPDAQAQPVLLENVWGGLVPLLPKR
jgi:acyl-CoA thioesterase-1